MSANEFTVSVCCITYNHEHYLAQAIESVLAQQTNFAVEMVIGEDCSPDGTRALAQQYAQRYPGRVRVIMPAYNLGIMPNLMATLDACQGEFIAFLEGDDYWTDPTKLQRQVDDLRANPSSAMSFHDAEIFDSDGKNQSHLFSDKFSAILPPPHSPAHSFSQLDLGRLGWFMPSAAMLFRASSLTLPLPAWFAGVFSGDYTLQLLSTRMGTARYLPRVMSRYRLHAGGVMQTSHDTLAQNGRRIFENEQFKRVFATELHPFFNRYLEHLYFERSKKLGVNGQRWQQLQAYFKAVTVDNKRLFYHTKRLLSNSLFLSRDNQ